MISKELLGEVLKSVTLKEILNGKIDKNIYFKIEEVDIIQYINIHELTYECKEWARIEHVCILKTYIDLMNYGFCELLGLNSEIDFDADTEPEAVFKACQWILEQKDRQ